MSQVRVRYAPSPTGIPHIGNIRTALFNYLFAKSQKGIFILRIEDTDQNRLIPGTIEKIKESLELLSLEWDEYYVQSARLDVYKKYLQQLKDENLAYEEEGAWRFKVAKDQQLEWNDLVHGPVKFSSDVIEDFIIIKSDGFPTYHFASVVDDHELAISHVFRGDEWISSTPKHLLLYQSLGWQPPAFLHLPPILGPDKKKLSKREGAKSVMEYLQEGYLPEALINFLSFLGWAPKGDRELFTLEELTKEFTLDRINKNSPIFNLQKLDWFNGQWIRKIDIDSLADRIIKHLPGSKYSKDQIVEKIPLVKERMRTLSDFERLAGFIIDESVDIGYVKDPQTVKPILETYKSMEPSNWTSSYISTATISTIEQNQLDRRGTLSNIGTAVSGSTVTPPLFDTLEQVGLNKTISRIENAIEKSKTTK